MPFQHHFVAFDCQDTGHLVGLPIFVPLFHFCHFNVFMKSLECANYTMKHIVSRMSSYFPNRWPLSYLNLIKNMKTYIRRQQHKNFKHQDIKQKEPPQKYRPGTISKTKVTGGLKPILQDPNLALSFCSGSFIHRYKHEIM